MNFASASVLVGALLVSACGGSPPAPARAAAATVTTSPAPVPSPAVSAPVPPTKPAAPDGKVTELPGSRVSLWLPSGMQRPTRLPFLKLAEPLLVVSFGEFTRDPASTDTFLAGAKDGAKMGESRPVSRGQAHGFLGHVAADETGLERQILALAAGGAVAMINLHYAKEAEPLVSKIVESVELDAEKPLDALALSGIQLGDRAGFEPSSAAAPPLLLTEPGVKPPLNGAPSLALMSVVYPKPNLSDNELGEMLGASLGHYQPDMRAAHEEELKIGTCPAYSFDAPGKDQGAPVIVYGFIARCPDSALLGLATARLAQAKAVLPRFQRVVRSLQLDDSILQAVP